MPCVRCQSACAVHRPNGTRARNAPSRIAPGGTYMCWVRYYDLKAGRHTLTLAPGAGDPVIEGLVLTDSPGSFEPK